MTNSSEKKSLVDMKKFAEAKDGHCLSGKYLNTHEPLNWECAARHHWKASWANVRRGSWCPACAKRPQVSLEDLKPIARVFGGKLLSSKYKNAHQKLLWSCHEGHRWRATYSNIRTGSWCPKCSSTKRFSLRDLQRIGREHGGRLISREYKSKSEPLRWECERGHLLFLPVSKVIQGVWCSQCSQGADLHSIPNRRRELIRILLASPDFKPKIDLNSIVFEFENHAWPIAPATFSIFENHAEINATAHGSPDDWQDNKYTEEEKRSFNSEALSSITSNFLEGFPTKDTNSDSDSDWETMWITIKFQEYEPRAIVQILENLRTKPAPESF